MSGTSRARVAGVSLTFAVVVAVAGGLYLLGSPFDERARRLDDRRVSDLASRAFAVDLFWTRRGVLPASLEELRSEPTEATSFVDPSTGRPYSYHALDGAVFELCAQFERSSSPRVADGFWTHAAGSQCFRRNPQTVK